MSEEARKGARFRSRISEASGRSVRIILLMLADKECVSIKPTIPQPAPSSRILRYFLLRRFSRVGRRGNGAGGDVFWRM